MPHNTNRTNTLFKKIKPSDYIQSKLDAYMKENGWDEINRPIGIHIRRTDHKLCIENSPDYLFINKIEELIKQDPKVKIFLCTDDVNLKHLLVNKYNRSILTREIKPRYANGGFEDGVIDLFLLSKCRELYGCCNSGFVEVASLIGKIPLTRLRK